MVVADLLRQKYPPIISSQNTRRLFSTLNRYAKPVSHSEIIALSEDNNCAIITRNLIETPFLKGKVLVNKNRSIRPENEAAFTNILTLYDIVKRILTDEKVAGMDVSGKPKDDYVTNRISDEKISADTETVVKALKSVIDKIPSLNKLFKGDTINRKDSSTNLIFRPIGQNVIFDVLKIAKEHSKSEDLLDYLEENSFNLDNPIWKQIFWDEETGNIVTEKARQRYAILLISESLSIPIKRTVTDKRVYDNFGIKAEQLKLQLYNP